MRLRMLALAVLLVASASFVGCNQEPQSTPLQAATIPNMRAIAAAGTVRMILINPRPATCLAVNGRTKSGRSWTSR